MPAPHRQLRKRKLETYVEPELYEWVHSYSASQRRSASEFIGWVLSEMRTGLQERAEGGTIAGKVPTTKEK